jgi:hypothetical protein
MYKDTRCFFAAARHLHENPPAGPISNAPYQRLVDAIVTKGEGESRMRGPVSQDTEPAPPQPAAQQLLPKEQMEADRKLGQDLLLQLIAMRDS